MNELLTWTLAPAAVAVVLLLLWVGKRRQRRAQDAAEQREAHRIALEAAEHAARQQRAEEARIAAEREETARLEAQAARDAAAAAEARRLAQEAATREAEARRRAEQQAEAERLDREQAAREAVEAERLEAEQLAREAETLRLAAEHAEAEREAARRLVEQEAAAREAHETARQAAEQARRRAEAEAAAAAQATRELRVDETLVLVADDSKIVRVKISRLLAAQGYRIALAESGEQALELMAAERPHVLITDVEMPGIDGFELTRQVRASVATAELPVLMITSSDDKLDEARAAGVTQLLGKPYSEEALIAAIEAARLAVRVPATLG